MVRMGCSLLYMAVAVAAGDSSCQADSTDASGKDSVMLQTRSAVSSGIAEHSPLSEVPEVPPPPVPEPPVEPPQKAGGAGIPPRPPFAFAQSGRKNADGKKRDDPQVPPPPVPEPPQKAEGAGIPPPPPFAFAQTGHKNADGTEMNETLATFPVQEVLRKHNIYRCMHGVPLLTWSNAGAQQAQLWVNHQQGVMVHGGHDGYGQNLAGLLPQWGWDEVRGVKMWYDEIANTNNGMVSGFGMNTGHYTQVVWRNTQQVGCASFVRSNCDNGNHPCLLACHYHPPGNMNYASEFNANVNSPVRSEQQCENDVDGNGGGSGGSSQCSDTNANCPYWAQAGFCATPQYQQYMTATCCSSCR